MKTKNHTLKLTSGEVLALLLEANGALNRWEYEKKKCKKDVEYINAFTAQHIIPLESASQKLTVINDKNQSNE